MYPVGQHHRHDAPRRTTSQIRHDVSVGPHVWPVRFLLRSFHYNGMLPLTDLINTGNADEYNASVSLHSQDRTLRTWREKLPQNYS